MSALSIIIVFGVLVPSKTLFQLNILTSFAQWIQTTGIFLFAIALATTHNEKLRYKLSLVGLSAMVGGSAWETINAFQNGSLVGLAFSYFLLPLTVLVFYISKWKQIMDSEKENGPGKVLDSRDINRHMDIPNPTEKITKASFDSSPID